MKKITATVGAVKVTATADVTMRGRYALVARVGKRAVAHRFFRGTEAEAAQAAENFARDLLAGN